MNLKSERYKPWLFLVKADAAKHGLSPLDYVRKYFPTDGKEIGTRWAQLAAEMLILQNHPAATRYFIESEALAQWLITSTKMEDVDVLSALLSYSMPRAQWGAGLIHCPSDLPARRSTVLFQTLKLTEGESEMHSVVWVMKDDPLETAPLSLRLLLGLCLYLKAFPDAASPGFPGSIKDPSHHKGGKPFTIRSVPQIINRKSPSKYHVEAFWRHLKSDFYTHKKGQWVLTPSHDRGTGNPPITVLDLRS